MRSPHDGSLQRKLLSVVFITTLVALVVALGAIVAYDLRAYHLDLTADLTTQAELLGHMTEPALTFDDRKLAAENLDQLRIRPMVQAAAIYTARGDVFAMYTSANAATNSIPPRPESDTLRSEAQSLVVFKRIVSNGDYLGTVYLRADYGLVTRLVDYVGIAAAAGIAALVVAFLLSVPLQRALTEPILAVAEVARKVVQSHDYSRRAQKISDDEVGVLVESFNDMLAEAERRTHELEHSYQEIAREMAERYRAQQEIMRLNTDLENRVRDRTAQLEVANKKLQSEILDRRSAEAEADRANRMKSEFLANMSHELRTPLNAILGFAEIIEDDLVTPEMPQYKEFLGDILASGRHLLRLINDVLDLAKVEAGKLEFHATAVNVDGLIEEVLSILRATSAAKSVRLESTVGPGLTDITLDAARFKQVLYNYISNAVKFTPENGRVSVRAHLEPDGAYFRLEVEDTGIGIAEDDLGRLFVEFRQLDAAATKTEPGTGLGLALTKRLVEAQGGSVGVQSIVGKGSTFYALYPCPAPVGAKPTPPRSVIIAKATAAPVAPKRAPIEDSVRGPVLVIDDDERSLRLMCATLAQRGYASKCVQTATDALLAASETPPAAVVLDLLMPEMDGFEFLDRFRRLDRCGQVPVIVWTVKDLSEDERARLRRTAQHIVDKGHEGRVAAMEELQSILAQEASVT